MDCGYFKAVCEEVSTKLTYEGAALRVIAILGPKLSGKKAVAVSALQSIGEAAVIVSLPEISNAGIAVFIERLLGLRFPILTGIEDIDPKYQSVLSDIFLTLRFRPDGIVRRWMITSSTPLAFADTTVELPDLKSDPETHRKVCESLLGDFELDTACDVRSVLIQASRELSVGNLAALVRTAKTLAISSSEPLSCSHLLRAFSTLSLMACPVTLPQNPPHSCSFSSQSPGSLSFDNFIGLSTHQRALIDKFINERKTILLISGPIGSGKSHLASSIVWNLSKPAARVTSADILRAKIGETEKALNKALMNNERLIIEDLDKLVPEDIADSTGSIQRCLPVVVSFLDRLRRDPALSSRLIVATTRECVNPLLAEKVVHVELGNNLSFDDKIALIQAAFPGFDPLSVTQFDLISLTNRSECVEYGRGLKMSSLRKLIHPS